MTAHCRPQDAPFVKWSVRSSCHTCLTRFGSPTCRKTAASYMDASQAPNISSRSICVTVDPERRGHFRAQVLGMLCWCGMLSSVGVVRDAGCYSACPIWLSSLILACCLESALDGEQAALFFVKWASHEIDQRSCERTVLPFLRDEERVRARKSKKEHLWVQVEEPRKPTVVVSKRSWLFPDLDIGHRDSSNDTARGLERQLPPSRISHASYKRSEPRSRVLEECLR